MRMTLQVHSKAGRETLGIVPNPTHGSGWIVQASLQTQVNDTFWESHPRQ